MGYRVKHPKVDMHPVNLEMAELIRELRERGYSWETIAKYAEVTAENAEYLASKEDKNEH